jgi:hypothetical protein
MYAGARESGSSLPTGGFQTARVKTTRYFREQVLRKRPYLRLEWIAEVLRAPDKREVQDDDRIRYWG